MSLTAQDFEAHVRRFFRADDVSDLELRRLYVDWHAYAQDRARVRGLELQLDYATGRHPFGGYAWWETRHRGGIKSEMDVDEQTQISLWLGFTHPEFAGRMRPYCPAHLLGAWRCTGTKKKIADDFAPVTEARTWTLEPDGKATVTGFPKLVGSSWRAIEADHPEIWFVGPRRPYKWRVYEQVDADELHVVDKLGAERMRMQRTGDGA